MLRMGAAAYTLAGTVLGALITTAAVVWQARIQDKRAQLDREEARLGRIFDHRRTAYTDFVTQARRYSDWIAASEEGWRNVQEPDDDDWNDLGDARGAVSLYGSTVADELAGKVQEALVARVMERTPEEFSMPAYREIEAFVGQVRHDLGVHD